MLMNRLIAHRGASAYAPENTMAAFEKAHEMGARWIETDASLLGDGTVVLFHDDDLKRCANDPRNISDLSRDDLSFIDVGRWLSPDFQGEKIPTLKGLSDFAIQKNIGINLELKPHGPQAEELVRAVIDQLDDRLSMVVSSFDQAALKLFHELKPDIPIGLLFEEIHDEGLERAWNLSAKSIHLWDRKITKKMASFVKKAGFDLYVYTVNNKARAETLLGWGVDGVFSDDPGLF